MAYRIGVVGGDAYATADKMELAIGLAVATAEELTQATGTPTDVEVRLTGVGEVDPEGRDATPNFLIGTARGRIERGLARARWTPVQGS